MDTVQPLDALLITAAGFLVFFVLLLIAAAFVVLIQAKASLRECREAMAKTERPAPDTRDEVPHDPLDTQTNPIPSFGGRPRFVDRFRTTPEIQATGPLSHQSVEDLAKMSSSPTRERQRSQTRSLT